MVGSGLCGYEGGERFWGDMHGIFDGLKRVRVLPGLLGWVLGL